MQLDFFRQLTTRLRSAIQCQSPAPVSDSAKSDAPDWAETARTLLRSLGCTDLAARVRVRWNARMRSTAGTACAGQALITLNPRLREFGDAEIDRTFRHELAHLLAQQRAGRRRIAPHGREWQQACRDLGLADETRCHDLPLPRRRMSARHFYRCPQCATVLPRVRPLHGKSACLACCRRHNRGSYTDRFRLLKVPSPPA